nr:MAG TPA: hypothetical protein [Caudoviricetes sp.]
MSISQCIHEIEDTSSSSIFSILIEFLRQLR